MAEHWDRKKLIAGLIFIGIGGFAAIFATRYDVGTMTRLGPGGFPFLLGIILALLGLAHIVTARADGPGDAIGLFRGKALLLIPLSIAVFGLTIDRLGLVPAVLASVFVAGLANPRVRWIEVAALSAILALFGAALFVYGLGLPFPLFLTPS